MKSSLIKLMIVGLLAATFVTVWPRAMPLVRQAFPPPVAYKPKPVLPPPGIKYLEQVEDLVFEMTNQARQAKGLAPLIKDAELRQVARAFSNDMLVRRFFDHTTPDGVEFDDRIMDQYSHRVFMVGENIWFASGYHFANLQRLAKVIVDDWMTSPGHRDNLLDPEFTHLGVGVSVRHQTIRATQEFVGKSKGFNLGGFFSLQAH
jgi:uncharacterized protein YkwD